jgi:hypothetical protein
MLGRPPFQARHPLPLHDVGLYHTVHCSGHLAGPDLMDKCRYEMDGGICVEEAQGEGHADIGEGTNGGGEGVDGRWQLAVL